MRSFTSRLPAPIKNALFALKKQLDARVVVDRTFLAAQYLRGQGIEIGALHVPLRLPSNAHAKYVDRMSVADLRQHYPELASLNLVNVDIVSNGESLSEIANASQDFCIANHFLEHAQNPLQTLQTLFRVLKPSGVLFMALPDKRFTFDRDRPVTPIQHLVRDFEQGPAWSKQAHFEEWVRLVEKVAPDSVAQRVAQLIAEDYSIHFHAWTQAEMLEMLHAAQTIVGLHFDIELCLKHRDEFIFILRKVA
jgi:ubiquinone/menaquinone biosynthesis C-methylase UbiE